MAKEIITVKKGKRTGKLDLDFIQLSNGAFVTIATVAVIQMLGVAQLSAWLIASIICFSFTICASAFIIIYSRILIKYQFKEINDQPLLNLVITSNGVLSMGGIAAIFFHLNMFAGVIFITAAILLSILSVWLFIQDEKLLETSNQ